MKTSVLAVTMVKLSLLAPEMSMTMARYALVFTSPGQIRSLKESLLFYLSSFVILLQKKTHPSKIDDLTMAMINSRAKWMYGYQLSFAD